MNRAHDARVALESIENSVRLGFKINLELIYGYPEQTFANWLEVLETAIRTDVNEIQLYRLKVIPYGDQEGVITKVRRIRPSDIPVAHDTLLMKQLGILLLAENGYAENLCRVFTKRRRDISLYAYNQCCLLYDQIGLGLTGFSSLRDRFGLNTQYFEDYYKAIEDQRLPLSRGLIRNREQQMRWAIVLPLKNYYIRKPHFTPGTQAPVPSFLQDRFATLKTFGLLFEDERKIALTPLGSFFADEVMTLFYEPMHIPFPESAYEAGPLNPYGLTSRMESSQTGQLHASAGVRTRTSAAAHQ
jgi:oxygen-independent coproporphyrinogen III oxidase